MTRARLSNRRAAELVEFEHAGRRWTATVGHFPDGRLAEFFLHAARDSAVLAMAQDATIIASIALQYGGPAAVITNALCGRDAGPLAAALALIPEGGP